MTSLNSRHVWNFYVDLPLVCCLFGSNIRPGWGLLSCVLISCAFVNSSSLLRLHAHPPLRLITYLWFVILHLCLWGIRSTVFISYWKTTQKYSCTDQFQLLRGLPDLKGSAGACDMVNNKSAFRLGLKTNRCAIHWSVVVYLISFKLFYISDR